MIYEYSCPDCEHVFEQSHRIGKAPKRASCPSCGKKCERHFGSVAVHFKGGGWPTKFLKFNGEMTKRNEAAGCHMEKTWRGTEPKLVNQD